MFAPTRSLEFELSIKGLDYTSDLYQVQIASSVTSPYQVVILDVFVDANDIILEELHGQDPCILNVKSLQYSEIETDQIKFDLMVVELNVNLSAKPEVSTGLDKTRMPLTITTVVRPAFKSMTTIVNKVYEEPKTVREVIEELIGDVGATPEYDTDKENTEKIEQIVIPPTTLYKAIRYLDQTFGLYDGVPVYYCDYENKVHIMNLTSRMNKAQIFTISQLASQSEGTVDVLKSSTEEGNFYTYDTVTTTFKGNSVYAVLSKNLKHIVKPKDTLYHKIEHDLDAICSDQGLISGNEKVLTDSNIAHRENYYIGHTGYEYTETFAKSLIAKRIASLSTISINIEKNLPVLGLIKIGEPTKFVPKTMEFQEFSGKYILRSSDLRFKREGEWQAVATIHLIRTNRAFS